MCFDHSRWWHFPNFIQRHRFQNVFFFGLHLDLGNVWQSALDEWKWASQFTKNEQKKKNRNLYSMKGDRVISDSLAASVSQSWAIIHTISWVQVVPVTITLLSFIIGSNISFIKITTFWVGDDPHVFRPQREIEVLFGIICVFLAQYQSARIPTNQSLYIAGKISKKFITEWFFYHRKANGQFSDFIRHDDRSNWAASGFRCDWNAFNI